MTCNHTTCTRPGYARVIHRGAIYYFCLDHAAWMRNS